MAQQQEQQQKLLLQEEQADKAKKAALNRLHYAQSIEQQIENVRRTNRAREITSSC
jgi:hypothetical protein